MELVYKPSASSRVSNAAQFYSGYYAITYGSSPEFDLQQIPWRARDSGACEWCGGVGKNTSINGRVECACCGAPGR